MFHFLRHHSVELRFIRKEFKGHCTHKRIDKYQFFWAIILKFECLKFSIEVWLIYLAWETNVIETEEWEFYSITHGRMKNHTNACNTHKYFNFIQMGGGGGGLRGSKLGVYALSVNTYLAVNLSGLRSRKKVLRDAFVL